MEYEAEYSYEDFEVWRLKKHPDHLQVPEFPTLAESSQEQPSTDTMLQYQTPFTTSESLERLDTLLGEAKRSSTKLPHNNSILVDIGSRINLIGRNTAQEFIAAAEALVARPARLRRRSPYMSTV